LQKHPKLIQRGNIPLPCSVNILSSVPSKKRGSFKLKIIAEQVSITLSLLEDLTARRKMSQSTHFTKEFLR
jgi:hypothetical protein